MEKKIKVLFLCTGNSARSQMAEAFTRKYGSEVLIPFSAGLEPKPIHPYTIKVLEEVGIDISDQYSKPVSQYLGKEHFGFLITVCTNAEAKCPIFPGVSQRKYWPFEDPVAFQGTEAEKLAKFREIRDQIEQRIKSWVEEVSTRYNQQTESKGE
ncbi:MAG TPA: low molecular weight phosphatase family protein [Propionibacteriaceae bacterium]|nr:low molecular weight phosphatase family protein [Propionibacteriaceae bacterium]